MYNGIGITTTRGTGTSGHVQRNVAALRPQKQRSSRPPFKQTAAYPRALPPALAAHERRRAVEVAVAELHDELVARQYDSSTITFMKDRLRRDLLSRDATEVQAAQQHSTAPVSDLFNARNDRLRDAFKVDKHYTPAMPSVVNLPQPPKPPIRRRVPPPPRVQKRPPNPPHSHLPHRRNLPNPNLCRWIQGKTPHNSPRQPPSIQHRNPPRVPRLHLPT
ncbi:Pre-mRNA-splicing factor CWC21 [Gracilariopsis chorda]|uniref:Pre-mRNA-splicing factor CWC21 n=1 Tax=Gracilariopsis chorda TaxID=448386 RepID=A0A2V3IKN5_9FLOR|nr:Pre-mRNA-splicing factor CWC21 [Gracilariopsis chorda]|eukprot:PXF41690.1 Pre-mRNA-splicing factor CWC21 [Gracilariopsis chorda]